MEQNGDPPPFWSQTPTVHLRQRLRGPPSPIINPVTLILLLPIITLVILFFLVPPFLSHTSQLLRPNSVKKGWDSFIILVVIFAILFGVFARKKDDVWDEQRNRNVSNVSPSGQWFEYNDRKAYDSIHVGLRGVGVNGLRRRSSSYPDLRQVPEWETGDNHFRFMDDFGVNLYRSTATEYDHDRRVRRSEKQQEESHVKVIIPVDRVEHRSSPPPVTSHAPPHVNFKRRRSFHSVSAPPPPPAPPIRISPPEQKLQRNKSDATKEIATAIASLYNQRKRKKRSNRRNSYETVSEFSSSTESVMPPQTRRPRPPPPPPPPPSKVFQNLFKKSSKSKRVHSVASTTTPPPPPPPPPSNSIFNNLFKTGTKNKRFQPPSSSHLPPPPPPPLFLNNLFKNKSRTLKSTRSYPRPPPPPPPPPQTRISSKTSPRYSVTSSKPPLPTKTETSYYDEKLNSGSQSPLIPLPPLPPFKMQKPNFIPFGDFVWIRSAHSSRRSSPELEDIDVVSVKSSSEAMDGEKLNAPAVFCPSPDVNVKADTFIARLRGEWRLEKMNSLRERQKLG
ncbi:hypothetical protein RND71_008224 [Anisodus tanguticus]|uniref:Uncharacterized protein n=1 Tax=Anisodus tanguticus TaxID=243964 RepID=A0AAE1SMU5_9SOLA|nr:hypothetical protein RND71_008224 [Anisodus tanguticus]